MGLTFKTGDKIKSGCDSTSIDVAGMLHEGGFRGLAHHGGGSQGRGNAVLQDPLSISVWYLDAHNMLP
jgi:hypothetical protein